MNRYAKGNRLEKMVENYYKGKGYITFRPVRVRFQANKDIFNMFDGISMNEKHIHFWQVKSKKVKKFMDEFFRFIYTYKSIDAYFEFWIYKKRRTFNVLKYYHGYLYEKGDIKV